MIVAFSTQAQHTADDGAGRNSPYTAAFLKHIEEQDEIGRVFRHISSDVYEGTDHKQLPELSLSIIGDYYLQGEPESPSAPAKVAVLVPQPGAPRTPVQPAVVTVPKPEVLFGPEPSQPPSTATPTPTPAWPTKRC